ncbi:MAG: rhomboid family intramembrane serine protease [Cytophagales bacterium]|nr:MAG: rhomboid family intramembrane serine protease [Cytophagales bacterium]
MNTFANELRNVFRNDNNTLVKIIVICVIVYLIQGISAVTLLLSLQEYTTYNYLESFFTLPASLDKLLYRPWTVLSYAFLHADPFHLFFNMIFMYWFGRIIVEFIGNKHILSLFVLGAIAGGLFYIGIYNLIPFFHKNVPHATLIGASAAVYAVVVGAATLVPNYTMYFLFIGPVRIKYIALGYVVISYISLAGSNAGGNLAHLGGALMGYIYIVQIKNGRDLGVFIHRFVDFMGRIFVRKPKMKVVHRRTTTVTTHTTTTNTKGNVQRTTKTAVSEDAATTNQAEIDAILDKISATGYDSLSKEEKQKLFKASQDL